MVSDNGDIRRGFWFIIDGIDGASLYILLFQVQPKPSLKSRLTNENLNLIFYFLILPDFEQNFKPGVGVKF